MTKTWFVCVSAVSLVALGVVSWQSSSSKSAAGRATQNAGARDPRLDMVTSLQAMEPHPSLGDQAKVFGRLVGTWDVE